MERMFFVSLLPAGTAVVWLPAALWRSGAITLDGLAAKYKKRPETFSRLFARMGIEKGSSAEVAMKRAEEAIAARSISDLEETLKRIAGVKDAHFKMSQAIAVMAFRELQQTKTAGLDVAKLKDTMSVYKLVGEIVGNSRRELFDILDVEKHDKDKELDDLPDLTVRELTNVELDQLRDQPGDDSLGEFASGDHLGEEPLSSRQANVPFAAIDQADAALVDQRIRSGGGSQCAQQVGTSARVFLGREGGNDGAGADHFRLWPRAPCVQGRCDFGVIAFIDETRELCVDSGSRVDQRENLGRRHRVTGR